MIKLTAHERLRFSTYLKQEAKTDKEMIEQMEKIKAPDEMIKRFKVHIMACTVVADKLDSIEEQTIGRD